MADLSVIVLTYNEALHIGRCLDALNDVASQVFVIDSFSTDDTVAIARGRGAVVIEHAFVNYARQFQWALDHAPIETGWVMRLDADEVVAPDLAAAIRETLPRLPADVAGVNVNRKHVFMGRWIRHGARYPLVLLRIWRRGQGRIEDRWMDEHMVVHGGRTVMIEGDLIDHNLNDLTFFIDKHNRYATREAIDVVNQRHGLFPRDEALSASAASRQASLTRIAKERLYNAVPFWLGVPTYFLYRYVVRLGFLDGLPGLIYHGLQGFWYRFLVGAKVVEFERALAGLPREEKLARLSRLTGYDLAASRRAD